MPMRREMKKTVSLPVYIDNDANVAALAESEFGAARGSSSSVTITLGTGVGGGIVINNRIFSGSITLVPRSAIWSSKVAVKPARAAARGA
jgi:glucokinase